MRSVAVLAIGIAAGFLIAALIFHGNNSGTPAAGVPESVSLKNTDGTMVAGSRSTEVEEGSASKPLDPEAVGAAAGRRDGRLIIENGLRKKAELEDLVAVETRQKLIAAGFTPDRADWLMQRVKELKAAQIQLMKESPAKPASEQPALARILIDGDLPLREEIGDADYARYREATGRVMGTPITGVIPDSNADRIGLKKGDDIVQYGGKHVYSYFDLLSMASENKSGGPTLLEVRRGGQTFQVLLPQGELGIEPEAYFSALLRSRPPPEIGRPTSEARAP
jgi:hypothetical protein